MKYILKPRYSDMSVILLGKSLQEILKKLKQHWVDEINNPEYYDNSHTKAINSIINGRYETVDELMEEYNELIDEDYSFEESY